MMRPLVVALALLTFPLSVSAAKVIRIGEPAPNFTLTSVTGETISLERLRGKVVVLGLFHICEPCRIQGTTLQKVHEAVQGKNVAVIGVNSAGNSKTDVLKFLSQFPVTITYPYLLDPTKETDRLYGGGRFIPNVYVIDQAGIIRWQRVGNMDLAGADVILQEVNKLLAAQGSGAHE
jgi:cytochrome c biogenesis protein CcmG/thiol:disulfide interchange protein DsbE